MSHTTVNAHDAPLASPAVSSGLTRSGAVRLDALDLLRGIVICLMVLDHVRDYFHASGAFDPMDVTQSNPALYLTRIITHFCAPTFVLLAGVSAFLQKANGKTTANLSRFLLTRGLWLIVLELTVVNIGWQFVPALVFLQVIWAIGWSMVALSALVWLPWRAVLAIGVVIIAGHNLLDGIAPEAFGAAAPLWNFLHVANIVPVAGVPVLFAYPVLPWMGVMAFGYGIGRVFLLPEAQRRRMLVTLGLSMVAAFIVLRGLQLYGDPRPWAVQDAPWKTVGDFLNVLKYPPSLDYVLMTLGPVLALIPALERLKGPVAAFFLPFGRVPLFVYVIHIYLAHALSMLLGVLMGYPAAAFINPFFGGMAPAGWGIPLLGVYAVWALVLAILYPLGRWFSGVKARRRDWWLGYL
ncbi:MAG: DUF1624 domain-containing protein [Brevundimonas sp.]|nr:MAG: DUF1624 domain-containing protein [Brevundimonas sp.]